MSSGTISEVSFANLEIVSKAAKVALINKLSLRGQQLYQLLSGGNFQSFRNPKILRVTEDFYQFVIDCLRKENTNHKMDQLLGRTAHSTSLLTIFIALQYNYKLVDIAKLMKRFYFKEIFKVMGY